MPVNSYTSSLLVTPYDDACLTVGMIGGISTSCRSFTFYKDQIRATMTAFVPKITDHVSYELTQLLHIMHYMVMWFHATEYACINININDETVLIGG